MRERAMSRPIGAPPSPGSEPGTEWQTASLGRAGVHHGPASFLGELAGIRQLVVLMGEAVDRAITRAVCGLVDRDVDVCSGVIAEAARLRSLQAELRRLCLSTVLERDPTANGRREAVALLHIAAEFERAGDHCASIARLGHELARLPEAGAEPGLIRMAEFCSEQVRETLTALITRDPHRARELAVRDDRLERLCRRLVEQLADTVGTEPDSVQRATRVLTAARLLERIADRVVIVAEDLVLVEAGVVELPGLHAEAVTGR
jgi:phosphate transport system protein